MAERWSEDKAWAWFRAQPWRVGCNFLPSCAINQLEMFQAADYDANRDVLVRELDWAAGLGFNTLRVFLHDLLWDAQADAFSQRLDDFLDLCQARGIQPLLVFFDSCHQPEPTLGRQPEPTPGYHNPGWAQSPAVSVLTDQSQWPRLERYVTEVLRRYGQDPRILAWDLYNEPCNGGVDTNTAKAPHSRKLTQEVFGWARSVGVDQPLTVCVWADPDPTKKHHPEPMEPYHQELLAAQTIAVEQSDIVSFHDYAGPSGLEERIARMQSLGRPLMCTEYMARKTGSTFADCLPILRREGIWAYNWGFVAGKSQTYFPWNSPKNAPEPELWFHDIFRPDGSPFDPNEPPWIRRQAAGETAPV